MRKFLLLGVCLTATTAGMGVAQADLSVKVNGWVEIEDAKREIMEGVARYNDAKDKPAF